MDIKLNSKEWIFFYLPSNWLKNLDTGVNFMKFLIYYGKETLIVDLSNLPL